MRNVVGPTPVAMATKFGLGAEIQSPIGLSVCLLRGQTHLFFVMEYLNGGDLMFHIQKDKKFNAERARFYAAELVVALQFLHGRGIVYRSILLTTLVIYSLSLSLFISPINMVAKQSETYLQDSR